MITRDPKQIDILRQGGQILADVLKLVAKNVRAGVTAWELDQLAEREILARGAKPSFKDYAQAPGDPVFPASLCVSVNDEVVHGIPTKDKVLQEGDIVGLDLGILYQGLYTDSAITIPVGKVSDTKLKLIKAANESLYAGLAQIKPGNFTGDIGNAIETIVKKYGFQVVRELVGHGVGAAVHEEPEVPCYGKPKTGTKLEVGMVLAIEPMVNEGDWKIYFAKDNWTIKTADGKNSAHAEHTIIVTDSGFEILTNMV